MLGHETPFHFRKYLMRYVESQIGRLLVEPPQPVPAPTPPVGWMTKETMPNPGYVFPLRLCALYPLRPDALERERAFPACFISYDGGRKDVTQQNLIQNIVEVIGVRLEIAINADYGAPDLSRDNGVTELSEQVGDAIYDIERLVNYNSFQQWLAQPVSVGDSQDPNIDDPAALTRFRQQAVIVQDVMLMEWGFDEFYRGTANEVIIAIVQFFMSYPKQ